MRFNFPPAPAYDDLTHIGTEAVHYGDAANGWRGVFPVYRYRDDANGELVLVTEDRFEALLDRAIEAGVYPRQGGAT